MLHHRMLSPLRYNMVKKFKGLYKRDCTWLKCFFSPVKQAMTADTPSATVQDDFEDMLAQYMYTCNANKMYHK